MSSLLATSEVLFHSRKSIGAVGEAIAARYLKERGLTVLARNWYGTGDLRGELDLVCRDGDYIVCVEVKTRMSRLHGDPLEAVTAAKVHALRRLLMQWCERHGYMRSQKRIDVVGIVLTRPHMQHGVLTAAVDYLRGIA